MPPGRARSNSGGAIADSHLQPANGGVAFRRSESGFLQATWLGVGLGFGRNFRAWPGGRLREPNQAAALRPLFRLPRPGRKRPQGRPATSHPRGGVRQAGRRSRGHHPGQAAGQRVVPAHHRDRSRRSDAAAGVEAEAVGRGEGVNPPLDRAGRRVAGALGVRAGRRRRSAAAWPSGLAEERD